MGIEALKFLDTFSSTLLTKKGIVVLHDPFFQTVLVSSFIISDFF